MAVLAKKQSYAKLGMANSIKALFSCSSSADRRCCRVCGSTAPQCLASPSSPSGPCKRNQPSHYRHPLLLRPPSVGGNLTAQTGKTPSVYIFISVPAELSWCLTQQGVHISLGVVEEASFPTDQIEGVDQVRAAQVLWRRNSLGARPGYNQ